MEKANPPTHFRSIKVSVRMQRERKRTGLTGWMESFFVDVKLNIHLACLRLEAVENKMIDTNPMIINKIHELAPLICDETKKKFKH